LKTADHSCEFNVLSGSTYSAMAFPYRLFVKSPFAQLSEIYQNLKFPFSFSVMLPNVNRNTLMEQQQQPTKQKEEICTS